VILIKAPLRISFIGGGSDFKNHFELNEKGGCIVGSSIDKYVYLAALPQPPFEEHRFRFTYRITEAVKEVDKIQHPVVRETLKFFKYSNPLNIATMADLPGRSGLGSSSAFTTAFVQLMSHITNQELGKADIAKLAILIERDILCEAGGMQDQYHSAVGGLREYQFKQAAVTYSEIIPDEVFHNLLSDQLFLIATGDFRDSTKFAQLTESSIKEGVASDALEKITQAAKDLSVALMNAKDAHEKIGLVGEAINFGWAQKLRVSKPKDKSVEELLAHGMSKGATASKLCGAGGSGFGLFLVAPENQSKFIQSFPERDIVRCRLESAGVTIVNQ
jgi:D-glycero-alpha-D-manno-heptose-7-phosphate kinase